LVESFWFDVVFVWLSRRGGVLNSPLEVQSVRRCLNSLVCDSRLSCIDARGTREGRE
jgi:hypothetical protein